MVFAWWGKRWKDTANNARMRERCSRVSEAGSQGSDEHVTAQLTRDRIRHVTRAPGGGKGYHRDGQKHPRQPESTRSEVSSCAVSVRLAEDAA